MQYTRLGRTGLTVSRLVLGSTMFGEVMDDAQAQAVIHRALELGVNTLDTGNVYGGGRAEEIIGRCLCDRRDRVVLCTKVGFRVGDSPADHADAVAGGLDHAARWARGISPNDQGLSRRHILAAVEASLRRLGTDYIDLYQIHRWDAAVPIEETLRALEDLVRSGKVRYLGCSNARSWQLYEALWTSERAGLSRFESRRRIRCFRWKQSRTSCRRACTRTSESLRTRYSPAARCREGTTTASVRGPCWRSALHTSRDF
jgi:1-deoxyxylulose-5-phosphate synthase